MGMRKFKRGLKGNQAIDLLLEMEREKAFGNGGIMCKCEECGGLGYAKDETLLDSNGYLKDANCLCGGRIKRVKDSAIKIG